MGNPIKQETGNKYGHLTVTSYYLTSPKGKASWNCTCDCGREVVVAGKSLRNGSITTCGCRSFPSKKRADKTGQVFGELTVVSVSHSDKHGRLNWLCQCSCGKQTVVSSSALTTHNTRSCGCKASNRLRVERDGNPDLERRTSTWGQRISRNKTNAAERGIEFTLSESEYIDAASNGCFYCDRPPEHRIVSKKYNIDTLGSNLDRIDSNLGYIAGNVVPCCKHCNAAKGDLTQEQFYNNIKQLYENLRKTGRI